MQTIAAIFEHGIFRPLTPVELPEGAQVALEISTKPNGSVPPPRSPEEEAHIERVYGLLSLRFDGGEKDIAARHNEHQP
jgi:predicted DNA-binding antitoxin AbrB/MazE fold protein